MESKENKGITLIALVITIIVLLILAGVVIATLTGENGVLRKSNIANKKMRKETYLESLKLAVIENKIEDNKILNIQTICQNNDIFKNVEYNYLNDEILMVITKEGYKFIVEEETVKEVELLNVQEGNIEIYTNYIKQGDNITQEEIKNYVLTGESTENGITIYGNEENTYSIYLYNLSVKVNGISNKCALNILEGANVNMNLIGTNILQSGAGCAGLQKSNVNGNLTIDGIGKVSASGRYRCCWYRRGE